MISVLADTFLLPNNVGRLRTGGGYKSAAQGHPR
jgi:hypothetical protein